jgi:hypothetical protein
MKKITLNLIVIGLVLIASAFSLTGSKLVSNKTYVRFF